MKKIIYCLTFCALFLNSCASEQYGKSPVTSSLNGDSQNTVSLQQLYGDTMKDNLNASEITNLISTFPKFRNDGVNKEVSVLKTALQNYLYSYEAYNPAGIRRAARDFEQSYKKLQKLRKYINEDEDNVLNRYLVRIKTNMAVLESAAVTAK